MSRDYAGHKGGGGKKTHARSSDSAGGLPGWLWALIGLSIGLCVAAIVFIVYRPMAGENETTVEQPAAAAPEASTPDIPPREKARFKFYDLLPKSEVKPSEEPYKPEPSSASEAVQARYEIQAGSFKAREDAERRKATIALIGIESSIREVQIDGKGLRYRITIGPPMSYRDAEQTMRQLADSDIDSFATRSGG